MSITISQFNRAIRFKANKMGYSLNQRGLFDGVVRDPRDRKVKLNPGMCSSMLGIISSIFTSGLLRKNSCF
jgi:hypothetical protein